MSEEKLLSTLDELERNFRTLSERGLERIAKMQSLSHDELVQNQSRDDLDQIAKMRRIKNHKRMLKES